MRSLLSEPRLLFVDDEKSIRLTIPEILRRAGFHVTVAATVAEAMEFIHRERFDILISDLNIGEPGDGFTVVSMMRRTQPEAATFILTGFPDFDTALKAIRSQVDDYLVKPSRPQQLIERLNAALAHRLAPSRPRPTHRVSYLIRDNRENIMREWLRLVNADPELSAIQLSEEERLDDLPVFLEELARTIAETPDVEPTLPTQSAARHGAARYTQGYTIPLILAEARLLHRVIVTFLQDNLLLMDISTVIPDMIHIGENLAASIEVSVRAFQRASR